MFQKFVELHCYNHLLYCLVIKMRSNWSVGITGIHCHVLEVQSSGVARRACVKLSSSPHPHPETWTFSGTNTSIENIIAMFYGSQKVFLISHLINRRRDFHLRSLLLFVKHFCFRQVRERVGNSPDWADLWS